MYHVKLMKLLCKSNMKIIDYVNPSAHHQTRIDWKRYTIANYVMTIPGDVSNNLQHSKTFGNFPVHNGILY